MRSGGHKIDHVPLTLKWLKQFIYGSISVFFDRTWSADRPHDLNCAPISFFSSSPSVFHSFWLQRCRSFCDRFLILFMIFCVIFITNFICKLLIYLLINSIYWPAFILKLLLTILTSGTFPRLKTLVDGRGSYSVATSFCRLLFPFPRPYSTYLLTFCRDLGI